MTVFDTDAFNLIVSEEVSDETTYTRKYQTPDWPGGKSGVTIGIGYDLGYVSRLQFYKEWSDYLSPVQMQRLETVIGLKGQAAKDALWTVNEVVVPWDVAIKEFIDKALPPYVDLTQRNLPNFDKLPLKCQGALVSLVYNRGASFNNKGDRYTEMNNIRVRMERQQYDKIPDEFRAMVRIWKGTSIEHDMTSRRNHEAKLFEDGLQPVMKPAPKPLPTKEITVVGLIAAALVMITHQVEMHPFFIVLLTAAFVGGVAAYFHKRGSTP